MEQILINVRVETFW